MKKLFVPLLFVTLCCSVGARAQSAQQVPDKDAGVLKFVTMTHDFGEVQEGPLAEYDFEFENTGKKPVIIKEAMGSCGCTTARWPKEPVKPNHKGTIHVMYNTNNRPGPIAKIVTITSDAKDPTMILHIKGDVKKADRSATTIH